MILGKYDSPIGELTIAVENDCLHGVWLKDQKYFGSRIKTDASVGEHPLLDLSYEWLDIYFSGKEPDFSLPLSPAGTTLASLVRQAMLGIPFGTTVSYSQLAESAGRPRAVRAVAGMVAHNPFLIMVPCHRVVGKDGSLTGFAAGLDIKRKLLAIERQSS